MSNERLRFIAPYQVNVRGEAITAIVGEGIKVAASSPCDGLLVTFPAKDSINTVAPLLKPILSTGGIKELLKPGSRINSKPPIQAVTDATLKNIYNWNGPVVLIYPSERMLRAIDDMRGVSHQIVIPWLQTAPIDAWIAAWSPTPIMGATTSPPQPRPILAIERALKRIYANNGLVTRSEREEAIETFETIIHFAPGFTPDELHAYLLGTLRWDGAAANEARKIYTDLLAGKQIRGRSGPKQELWDYWSRPS